MYIEICIRAYVSWSSHFGDLLSCPVDGHQSIFIEIDTPTDDHLLKN